MIQRKKKFLDFVTSRKAETWMQKEAELVEKDSRLEKAQHNLNQLKDQDSQLRQSVVDMLSKLQNGHHKLVDAVERVEDMQKQATAVDQESKRLVDVEKIWEKKSPAEIEQTLNDLQAKKTDIDQTVRQRTAIRDDKMASLESADADLQQLMQTIDYLEQKAREGRQTVEQRLQKRDSIKSWYEKCSGLLSSTIGFSVYADKENHCISAKFAGIRPSDTNGMDVKITLNPKDASIKNVWTSLQYPVDDLLKRAQQLDDFSWLLRQLHHRFLTFEWRQMEMDQLIESGKNIIYNASQSPDTVLAIVNDAVFAFELSRNYPLPASAVDHSVKPMIRLVSAESVQPTIVNNVKSMIEQRLTLSTVLSAI